MAWTPLLLLLLLLLLFVLWLFGEESKHGLGISWCFSEISIDGSDDFFFIFFSDSLQRES